MLIVEEKREVALHQECLPENILKLANGEFVHAMLTDDCRPLKMTTLADICPDGVDVVPLWEGNSSTVGFRRTGTGSEFIKYDFEYPDRFQVLGPTINSVITHMLVWYWSEEEADEDDLREVARLLEYPYIDDLLDEIEDSHDRGVMAEWETQLRYRSD